MFKKLVVGLIAGALLFAGTAFAEINDKKLYEFRSRSVIVLADYDMFATGINYDENDLDTITVKTPLVGVYAQRDGECWFYMTLYGTVPMMGGPNSCDVLPELMQENDKFVVGHWLSETDSLVLFTDDVTDAKTHIDSFWKFVNKEYQEAQRP